MAIKLYWWGGDIKGESKNFGDLLSLYLTKKISGKKVISIEHPSRGPYKHFFKNYICIGSIIAAASKKSVIWGSGIIHKNQHIENAKFAAVRGPRTRQRILELGYSCPEIYGDPAILLPDYYNPQIKKQYKIGIIPHYVDYEEIKKFIKNSNDINVIDLVTRNIEDVVDEILKCEAIVSSSLHGVIVGQAYNIPSLWVKFSNKLGGDNVKFFDYFESMNIDFKEEIFVKPSELSLEVINSLLHKHSSALKIDKDILLKRKRELIEACPFN